MGNTPKQVDRLFISIYSLIIHLEISIQNISLVLSCESHPNCKSKATDNYIKRSLRKVNNLCTPQVQAPLFYPWWQQHIP